MARGFGLALGARAAAASRLASPSGRSDLIASSGQRASERRLLYSSMTPAPTEWTPRTLPDSAVRQLSGNSRSSPRLIPVKGIQSQPPRTQCRTSGRDEAADIRRLVSARESSRFGTQLSNQWLRVP